MFFGDINNPEGLVQIMLDLFQRKKIKDRYGFKAIFRLVAHCGYFQFWLDEKGNKTDLTGPDAIKTFRLEKEASREELVVSEDLFKGLQAYFVEHGIKSFKEPYPILLKSFEKEPIFIHRLFISKEGEAPVDLVYRLEELRTKTREIEVLAGLYPPIDIEKNFINLTITNIPKEDIPRHHEGLRVRDKGYREEFEEQEKRRKTTFSAKELFGRFNKGLIYGLPGAGKTTILHYFVWATFNMPDMLPIYVRCKQMPGFEAWCQVKEYDQEEAIQDIQAAIKYITCSFLFPNKPPNSLTADEYVALQAAEQQLTSAWADGALALYIDGLDEAEKGQQYTISSLVKNIMGSISRNKTPDKTNRVFLTSRRIETIETRKVDEPVFEVALLDMEQLRELARTFYGADSKLYEQFDEVLWRQEVVKKVAGTPLTALLLMIYYENFRRIDSRYLIYDLLLKFFILRVWDKWIKEERFKRRFLDIRDFFEEAKGNLMQKYEEVSTQYDCLSLIAYECLYESTTGVPIRDININNIKQHFVSWLEKDNKTPGNRIEEDANKWIDGLVQIQLFIPSGSKEYTLMHSTFTEFLAARWILNEIAGIDINNRREIHKFEGHTSTVNSCAFSPDGNTILSASADHTLRLWDVKTGKELYRLELLWIPLDISINPRDPKMIATANSNSTLTLFCLEMLETGSNSSV